MWFCCIGGIKSWGRVPRYRWAASHLHVFSSNSQSAGFTTRTIDLSGTSGRPRQWVDVLWPLTLLWVDQLDLEQVHQQPEQEGTESPRRLELAHKLQPSGVRCFEMKLPSSSTSEVQPSSEVFFSRRVEISFVSTICGFSLPPTSLPL